MYPKLVVDIRKIRENMAYLASLCEENGVNYRFLVTKVLAGNKKIVKALMPGGFTHLADSRIANLKTYRDLPFPKVLLRLPAKSEITATVRYSDISLNSEISTIKLLNRAARKQNKKHQIILMFDLGDLREGIFFQTDYLSVVKEIISLPNIELTGIGTNLTCYGGIIPTVEHYRRLLEIKAKIEKTFGFSVPLISGGNSSTVPLLLQKQLPEGINNLRLGEAVFLGRETAYGHPIPQMHQNAFNLEAEIIEVQTKPSYPIGEIGLNSFGEKPTFTDSGLMKRAIVALGKQDIQFDNLLPQNPSLKIIGGSSDHLIVDISKTDFKVGDILKFNLNYPGLLQTMTSPYVKKEIINY